QVGRAHRGAPFVDDEELRVRHRTAASVAAHGDVGMLDLERGLARPHAEDPPIVLRWDYDGDVDATIGGIEERALDPVAEERGGLEEDRLARAVDEADGLVEVRRTPRGLIHDVVASTRWRRETGAAAVPRAREVTGEVVDDRTVDAHHEVVPREV